MPQDLAPLPLKAIRQIQDLANALREFEVAPLIGTGLSSARGLPRWRRLVDSLILAWRHRDSSEAGQRLTQANYLKLIRRNFGTDLAVISYLRHRVDEYQRRPDKKEDLTFSQLLYDALYTRDPAPEDPEPHDLEEFTPTPNNVHFHLVSLFRTFPRRIWTTNYDDLIETAAKDVNIEVNTLDPDRRRAKKSLSVAHLHGFLAPAGRREGHPDPAKVHVSLALAEDDYHVIAADISGWTNREFLRLFDEHTVLMLGISLEDPNIRRVLATLKGREERKGGDQEDRKQIRKHYVVMRSWGPSDVAKTDPHDENIEQHDGIEFSDDDNDKTALLAICAEDSDRYREWYWEQHGVEVIEVPSHEHVLPFLLRLRYEAEGEKRGDLWEQGAHYGYGSVNPWDLDCQRVATALLDDTLNRGLPEEFGCDSSELEGMGMLLLRPEAQKIPDTLELTFRANSPKKPKQGERTFSADPDRPTGLAGRVFVSGVGAKVRTSSELYDYGIPEEERRKPDYDAIISVPIIDWGAGGLPLGVIYVTLTTDKGVLGELPEEFPRNSQEKSLESLYLFLQKVALEVLRPLRKMGAQNHA